MEREAKGFQHGSLRAFMHQVHAKKRKNKQHARSGEDLQVAVVVDCNNKI